MRNALMHVWKIFSVERSKRSTHAYTLIALLDKVVEREREREREREVKEKEMDTQSGERK